MKMGRWTLGVFAAASIVLATPVFAQLEWFPENGMSYVRSRSLASGATAAEERCAYASLNEPKSCPWCRQYDRCRQLALKTGSGASSRDRVNVDETRPPLLDATVRAVHAHGVEFRPRGFRLDARVATYYENRGKGTFGNRAIGEASGEVYLRVPAGVMLEYVANMRLQWNPRTGRGSLQLVGVPNTGADLSAGFGYHAHHLPGGSPAFVSHRGRLRAGVYRLIWSIGVDSIGHQSQQGMAMLAELNVEPTQWPQCTPEGMLPVLALAPPVPSNVSRPVPQWTPMRLPIGPGRQDRATRANPESRLVDINLKGLGDDFQKLTRRLLLDANLPGNACVVAGHATPDYVYYNNEIPVPAEELAKLIHEHCWPDEPVVLLACNSGQDKDGGLAPYAQRLSRALRDSGRISATVLAPTSYVTILHWRNVVLPSDPYIDIWDPIESRFADWWHFDSPVFPNAKPDWEPRFKPFIAE